MKKLLESLIRKVYYHYRSNFYRNFLFALTDDVSQLRKYLETFEQSIKEPLIRFGGFEPSYDNYGWHYCQEVAELEKTKIYEHVIILNQCFLNNLVGYIPNKKNHFAHSCTFTKLIETLAHEIAHALQIDLHPEAEKHEKEHKKIKKTCQK